MLPIRCVYKKIWTRMPSSSTSRGTALPAALPAPRLRAAAGPCARLRLGACGLRAAGLGARLCGSPPPPPPPLAILPAPHDAGLLLLNDVAWFNITRRVEELFPRIDADPAYPCRACGPSSACSCASPRPRGLRHTCRQPERLGRARAKAGRASSGGSATSRGCESSSSSRASFLGSRIGGYASSAGHKSIAGRAGDERRPAAGGGMGMSSSLGGQRTSDGLVEQTPSGG
ncbi:calumenin-B [Panicum miliaceum]|uniref:Calumenin-B n=1 Tax=Panicum miliaceum TaxID=4540 RepID=A0A3L6TN35_PANMI|nr:calumenin-B [Panicum miliaceum]